METKRVCYPATARSTRKVWCASAKMKNDQINKEVEEELNAEIEEQSKESRRGTTKSRGSRKELWAEQKMLAYERGEEEFVDFKRKSGLD